MWPVAHPLLDRSVFPELERPRAELLALPVHQLLTDDHVAQISDAAVAVLRP